MKGTTAFPQQPILIVDDEEQSLRGFEIGLKASGINNAIICRDSRDVLGILRDNDAEAIILDLTMPHMSGEELLPKITQEYPDIPVIIATGAGEIDTAVNCMKHGAFDYMVKPVSKERLISGARRAIELRELKRENSLLKQHVLTSELKNPDAFEGFDSVNKNMLSIFCYSESIATSAEPVLITGETGVGKEVMARAIHDLSACKGEFVPVNVAGIDDNTFSDTLFGHKKGAFTDATEDRKGMIDRASGGTLFLDEIGDLGPGMQVKLLRLLQEREYLPLGMDVPKRTNARIVVATNKSLEDLKDPVVFRKDLYYRLRHHHINLLPLRDRPDDLPLLLNRMVRDYAEKLNKRKPTVTKEVIALLSSYDFPGNVRELEAMVNEAITGSESGSLAIEYFEKWISQGTTTPINREFMQPGIEEWESISFGKELPTLKHASDKLIEEAIARTNGNQASAAKLLGITRQALNRRILSKKS